MPKRGLPETHARCATTSTTSRRWPRSAGAPIGRMVPIDQIDPNPNQPRQVMGDLSELMASIAEKGIIEPLIVRQRGDRFQIIAGERRYQAAVQVGLRELPVVIRDVDDNEMHRARADREHPAQGPDAVRRSGGAARRWPNAAATRTRTWRGGWGSRGPSITESLALNDMPDEVRNLCRLADIHSKSLLLQVVRQDDPQKMTALVEKIASDGGATREAVRKETAKPKAGPAQALRLQLPAADQGVQAEAEVHQVARRPRRSHRRARGHHQRAEKPVISWQLQLQLISYQLSSCQLLSSSPSFQLRLSQ